MSLRPPPVIDCPGITASAFLGGSGSDWARDVAVDAAGYVYVTGFTYSSNFPTSPGAFDPYWGIRHDNDNPDEAWAAFVAKFAPAGSLEYSTFLGGSKSEIGWSIATDAFGNAYVTGTTNSSDFPVTPGAFQPDLGGQDDAFVAKFDRHGDLVFSTFLGGNGEDVGYDIAVDTSGSAYVTGATISENFPAMVDLSAPSSQFEVFVTKLNPAGSGIVYSTLIGGVGEDAGHGISLDSLGNTYVTGTTYSSDFPVTNESVPAPPYFNAFVLKLNPAGDVLLYSSIIGGGNFDDATAIATDTLGNAYITGFTRSNDFPEKPSKGFDPYSQRADAFVAKFNETGDLSYSYLLGGEGLDDGWGIAVDAEGHAHVAGYTYSDDFPTTVGALDRTPNALRDAFVAELDPTGTGLVYSTYLGGAIERHEPECLKCGDLGWSLAIDPTGNVTVVGGTNSEDFPVTEGSFDSTFNGFADAFVVSLKLVPEPNRNPVAWFTVEPSLNRPDEVTVNASRSADAEDVTALLEVRWDWENDGVWDIDWSRAKTVSHRYAAPGQYTIVLEVRDIEGLTDKTETTLDLKPPLALQAFFGLSGEIGDLTVSFGGDPSGGTPPYAYLWDFGDGGASTLKNPTHTYAQPGPYTVTLTVTDAEGRTMAKSMQVVVPEPGPPIPGMTVLAIVVAVGIVAAAGYVIIRRFRPRLR